MPQLPADVALCAVPQWSPFQPPLSLPSLAAWLRRKHYRCDMLDENLEFYDFLFSDRAVSALKHDLSSMGSLSPRIEAAIDALECWPDFRRDLDTLRAWNSRQQIELEMRKGEFARDTYRAIRSLDTYLRFVSVISKDFVITPYDFKLKGRGLNREDIESFLTSLPSVISTFAEESASRVVRANPRVVGLSCIGQEQFLFALLLGAEIKKRSASPVVIGGTVFSRLAERGVIPVDWFGAYFDIIVRNEGEIPLTRLVALSEWAPADLEDVPGILYASDGEVITNKSSMPLQSSDIPIPDFDGLPLDRYLTGKVVLPILSSRGCYWGKCEFCHHGMVYGEKYQAYSPSRVRDIVDSLAAKHAVHYFSFNDEALPPSLLRRVSTEWDRPIQVYFTGLIKFENFFELRDFQQAFYMGFRALFVGLESASERVLALMRKNTSLEVMIRNLADATEAGISMHCFLFFGFPGEQHEDAIETINFIKDHADIIGSYGAGVFSLEHNAPIMRRLADHGVTLVPLADDELDIYYRYSVSSGISQEKAFHYVDQLVEDTSFVKKFRVSSWIPREYLLVLRSLFNEQDLVEQCERLTSTRDIGIFDSAREEWSFSAQPDGKPIRLINRLNSSILEVQGDTWDILKQGFIDGISARELCEELPWVEVGMASRS